MSEIKDINKEKILYSCESEITSDSFVELFTYFPKTYLVYVAYGTILCLVSSILLGLLVKEKFITGLVLFIVFEFIILIAYRIRLKKMDRILFKELQERNQIDTKHTNEFYEEYLIRKSKSRTLKLYYNKISKVIETNSNFYIKFSGFIITLQKDKCSEDLNNFIREKCQNKLKNKEVTTKRNENIYNSKKVKTGMLIIFILSLLSLLGAIYTNELLSGNSTTKNIWVFWLWLPIPIISIILGFKFTKKGFKCKKNIISGFIISFLLFIYGAFSFINFDLNHYKTQIINIVDQNKEEILKSVQSKSFENIYKIDGIEKIYDSSENGYVLFYCYGKGLVSESWNYGFYYSYDGEVKHVFDISNIDLTFDGTGYYDKESIGDNTYYTEKIDDNIYYYEAHF